MRIQKQKTTTVHVLEGLGLSENEALLYATMLRNPKSTVQELATRSPFPRTMLYHVLNQLIQRKLVTPSKDKWRTRYIAENPERLHDLLAQRERDFERQAHAVREIIPDLKSTYRLAAHRPDVRIFEGIEEYKKALEDIIVSRPKTVCAYETLGKKQPGLEVRELHEQRRITKKIPKQVLFVADDDSKRYFAQRKYDDFSQFRTIGKEIEALDVNLILYDGKLLYISYDAYEPTVILIEDAALYTMQRMLFLGLWKQAQKVHLLSTTTKET